MLKKIQKYFKKPVGVVAISFGLIPFLSPKQQPYVFNFDQTINIYQPGEKWPVEKLLTPVEKQVISQFGKPDCFRILWDSQGKIKVRSALEQEWKSKGPNKLPPASWVYLQRNEEIIFVNNSYRAQPLTETVHLVLKMGDPELVKNISSEVTQWTYYSTGKLFTISDDKVVDTKEFPAMGSFHK